MPLKVPEGDLFVKIVVAGGALFPELVGGGLVGGAILVAIFAILFEAAFHIGEFLLKTTAVKLHGLLLQGRTLLGPFLILLGIVFRFVALRAVPGGRQWRGLSGVEKTWSRGFDQRTIERWAIGRGADWSSRGLTRRRANGDRRRGGEDSH